MDYKNPNKVEEDLGDPVKMLEKFRKAELEMEALQNNILEELKKAIAQLFGVQVPAISKH